MLLWFLKLKINHIPVVGENNYMTNKNQTIKQQCPLCGSSQTQHAYTTRDILYNKETLYDYFNCNHCKAVFISPMPSEKQIASFYPDQYMVYEEVVPKKLSNMEMAVLKLRFGYKHLNPSFISVLFAPVVSMFKYKLNISFIKNGKILDIGCGNGKYLSKMKNLGWQSFGVEFNDVAVKACKKNNLDVFQGELKNAHFEPQEMDLVTARHVIEHIPDVNSFFEEVNKVLKPGGLFHLRTPNTNALGRKFFSTNWYANDAPRHLILFSPENLTQRAEQHGFEEVCSYTLSSPKIILNSYDYKTNNTGKPSRKKSLFRLLAKPYVFFSKLLNRGDEIYAVYRKIK